MPVARIHPTQFFVGMITVKCRQATLEKKGLKKLRALFKKKKNHIPAVIGPYNKFYIIDRHHLSRALFGARTDQWLGREQEVVIRVVANTTDGPPDSATFWEDMTRRNRVYPYDQRGRMIERFGLKLAYMDLGQLTDNPYRTLAKWVREGCGFIKNSEKKCVALQATETPATSPAFLEMYWAHYLRTRIGMKSALSFSQLQHLYPQALKATLDRKPVETFFKGLGLDPENYGQNMTGNHLELLFEINGCVTKKRPTP